MAEKSNSVEFMKDGLGTFKTLKKLAIRLRLKYLDQESIIRIRSIDTEDIPEEDHPLEHHGVIVFFSPAQIEPLEAAMHNFPSRGICLIGVDNLPNGILSSHEAILRLHDMASESLNEIISIEQPLLIKEAINLNRLIEKDIINPPIRESKKIKKITLNNWPKQKQLNVNRKKIFKSKIFRNH